MGWWSSSFLLSAWNMRDIHTVFYAQDPSVNHDFVGFLAFMKEKRMNSWVARQPLPILSKHINFCLTKLLKHTPGFRLSIILRRTFGMWDIEGTTVHTYTLAKNVYFPYSEFHHNTYDKARNATYEIQLDIFDGRATAAITLRHTAVILIGKSIGREQHVA